MKKQKPLFFSRINYHPIVYILLIGTMLVSLTTSMSVPFLAVYLDNHSGLGYSVIGIIIGAAPLAATFGGFLGGVLSDLFGRKKLMLISLVFLAITYFFITETGNPYLLTAISIFRGLSAAFFGTVSKTLMGDVIPPEKRYRVFSLKYFSTNLGYAVGPVAGVYFGIDGSSVAFPLTGFACLLYAIVLFAGFMYKKSVNFEEEPGNKVEKATLGNALHTIKSDRALLFFIIGGIILTAVHGQMSVYVSQYLNRNFRDGIEFFSYLLSIHGLTIVILQLPLTRMFEKYKGIPTITAGALLLALGEVGFGFSETKLFLIISMVIFTIGEIFIIPSEYAVIDSITPEQTRGTYYGTQELTQVGSFLGPWFAGTVFSQLGAKPMFVCMAILAVVSILFYMEGMDRYKKQHDNDYGLRNQAIEKA
ncbi:MDR family MFS transporter [Peribacillus glennii]|uniref:MFS transporter n=1 Tax=Peribacillus glennii TaxID=2303991 RepID=A0A372LAS0_9BACI|nr:MFS transporter [Peribacillus glennii]RFU62846.1 MFS transporter [Peribacillus glennii]